MYRLLQGILAGVVIGILVAPDKGTETRKKLMSRFNDYKDDAESYVFEASDRVKSTVKNVSGNVKDKVKGLAGDVKSKVDDITGNVKSKTNDANEAIQNS